MCTSDAGPPRDKSTGGRPAQNAQEACAALLDQFGGGELASLPDTMIQRCSRLLWAPTRPSSMPESRASPSREKAD